MLLDRGDYYGLVSVQWFHQELEITPLETGSCFVRNPPTTIGIIKEETFFQDLVVIQKHSLQNY